ncbi:MAG: hypothetical protein OEV44_01330 [Spirochaetota bacterium]|nr:hypothetical protein [Spirochaetota bacterium]
MALNRVDPPQALPVTTADYQAQNNLTQASFLTLNETIEFETTSIFKGTVLQVGGTVYLADADTTITGTASNYVKITPAAGGATAAASFVANLTGVTWNSTYNGYYDGSGNLYIFDEALAIKNGALTVAKTKDGRNKQPLTPTSDVQFNNMIANSVKTDNTFLKTKTFNLGFWNMNTTRTIAITHGLTLNKIRSVDILIQTDTQTVVTPLTIYSDAAGVHGGFYSIQSGGISLTRADNGYYDSIQYESTLINRGWMIITYEV